MVSSLWYSCEERHGNRTYVVTSLVPEAQSPQLRTVVRMAGWAVCEVPRVAHGSMSGSVSVIPVLGWGKRTPHSF